MAVDDEHVAASFRSERSVRVDGRSLGPPLDPLSAFFACDGDGWVRLHGNYPHHRSALVRALGDDPAAGAGCAPRSRSRRPSSGRAGARPDAGDRGAGRAPHARRAGPRAGCVAAPGPDDERFAADLRSPLGVVRQIAPPGTLDGRPLTWPHGARPTGSDTATWAG